jgi:hypothetical protein
MLFHYGSVTKEARLAAIIFDRAAKSFHDNDGRPTT